MVVEEKFVNKKDIHPLQAVGYEGIFLFHKKITSNWYWDKKKTNLRNSLFLTLTTFQW